MLDIKVTDFPFSKKMLDLGLNVARLGLKFGEGSQVYQKALDAHDAEIGRVLKTEKNKLEYLNTNPWFLNEFGGLTKPDYEASAVISRAVVIGLDTEADIDLLHLAALIVCDSVVRTTLKVLAGDYNQHNDILLTEESLTDDVKRSSELTLSREEFKTRVYNTLQLLVYLGFMTENGSNYSIQTKRISHIGSVVVLLKALGYSYGVIDVGTRIVPAFLVLDTDKELDYYLDTVDIALFGKSLRVNGECYE